MHPESDQKLILPLIIVTYPVKRRALHVILGEIGVVFQQLSVGGKRPMPMASFQWET